MSRYSVIGLTGGIGSGKSTVARMFGALGVHWVDADDVARQVVEPGTQALRAIADHFGESILQGNGELDRAALRQKVFEDPEQRRWLEGLLHPIIRQELIRQLSPEDYNLPYVMLVSPLLLETNQHELVERIVVVDVPEETQINRTMTRDGNSREQVERILAAQMPRAARREKADAIINNAQPLERVEASVQALHQRFLADFSQGA
ncbi:dephospho-CoA kinase [Marinobacter nauticus]|uniref:dephospho-CoA kinase n=1 Tax=Marinobacter nauticus TaxID=2743 RepID=UPI001C99AB2B|nr:dephospho-CoA kinase [Marinobacter nauticus]MBY5937718.1 dephospho-CoA kinase [Marinobacter nauticus]MBY5954946.1 dephospho-CoA kinase [Marinobacter nauticus]MBY6008739.1 dephospho-CoA kinase [Marinobacter nauticus]